MNISKKDIKMLLILFGIVIFVLCYFTVYLRYTEENEFLIEDIEDADYAYRQLIMRESGVPGYRESVALAEEFIIASQEEYPQDVHVANLIMYVVELQERIGIGTGGISFVQPVDVMTVLGLEENEDGRFSFTSRHAYRTGINVNLSMTYQQFKDFVNYIYNESPKTSIQTISLSYNTTSGLLYGNAVINKHFLSTQDMEYVAAQIPEMSMGLPNPFGAVRPALIPPGPPGPPGPPPQPAETGENNEEAD